jgi:hypothetical protein
VLEIGLAAVGHDRGARVRPDLLGVAHHVGDAGQPAESQDDEAEREALGERHAGGVGRDDGGEGIDGRAQRADAGPDHDDRNAGHRVVAGGDHHRDEQRIEGEGLLGHAIGRPAQREQRHQDRDHPLLASLERDHGAADAGVDRAGARHQPEKGADEQHEQGDVGRAGLVAVRIVEARNRRHEPRDRALGVGLDPVVGARHGHLAAERLVHLALVLASGQDKCQEADKNDQPEQDGVGGREL